MLVVALAGGSSRGDVVGQVVVRLAGLGLIAALLLSRASFALARYRSLLWFLGIAVAVVLVQLVPLPPAWWTMLPGRTVYAQAAVVANVAQPWRPINLTPERGWNAAFSLIVPIATVIGLSALTPRERERLLPVMVLIVGVAVVIGILQLASGNASTFRWYTPPGRTGASGLFANRNHGALLYAIGFPLLATVWVTYRARTRWAGPAAVACMVLLALLIPATGSRAGLALAAVALIAAAWIARRHLVRLIRGLGRRARLAAMVAVPVAVATTLGVALTFARADSVRRLIELDAAQDLRAKALLPGWSMTQSFFPFGAGFGSFDPVYRRFEPDSALSLVTMNQLHNDPLQVVLEGGVAGLVLLLAFLGWWIVHAGALMRSGRRDPTTPRGRLGAIAIGLTLVASIPDYPARAPLTMMLVAIWAVWMVDAWRAGRLPAADH